MKKHNTISSKNKITAHLDGQLYALGISTNNKSKNNIDNPKILRSGVPSFVSNPNRIASMVTARGIWRAACRKNVWHLLNWRVQLSALGGDVAIATSVDVSQAEMLGLVLLPEP